MTTLEWLASAAGGVGGVVVLARLLAEVARSRALAAEHEAAAEQAREETGRFQAAAHEITTRELKAMIDDLRADVARSRDDADACERRYRHCEEQARVMRGEMIDLHAQVDQLRQMVGG